MKRHHRNLNIISSINLTSLLDVTFLLLIAFMIIAPVLKYGLTLELPEVKTASRLEEKNQFTITVLKRMEEEDFERIYLNEKRVTLNELTEELRANYQRAQDVDVIIEADKNVPYGTFAQVIEAVQAAGVENIGMVTQPVASTVRRSR
jgi:biopolymer transport protein TolR